MKALVLAAGKGTRLKPLTNTLAKHLLPVANKPILYYVIEQIVKAGLDEIGIVVSPETMGGIKQAVSDGARWNARISYIVQSPALGLAHAVKVSQDFLGDSSFLLFLGDNIFQSGVNEMVSKFLEQSPEAVIGLKSVPDPRSFGVAELNRSGEISRVVEKPPEPRSNLALVGAYIITPFIHRIIENLRPSWRGEYEITDAIQGLLEAGKRVSSHIFEGWWLDTGKKEDLLQANRIMLESLESSFIRSDIDNATEIRGKVDLRGETVIQNSKIIGPVSIASGCTIISSEIGPYTCLGEDTSIQDSKIARTVILNKCRISGMSISNSLVGNNVTLLKKLQTKESDLFIGDDSILEI